MSDDELNKRIRAPCEKRGYRFKPWEIPPWWADEGPCPYPPTSGGGMSWPKAVALRGALIARPDLNS